jgi:hypothetical protein
MISRLRDRLADDRGISMAEIVTSMALMLVVMAIFTTGIVQMFNAADKGESLAVAQAQNNIAFLRLDKQIRYASAISTEGTVGGDEYVEYLIANTGTATCYQLRLTGTLLQQRTWIQDSAVPGGGWTVLASGVSSAEPFTFIAADDTFSFQRLRLQLTAASGNGGTRSLANTDITFTALNTTLSAPSPTVCTEGRPS